MVISDPATAQSGTRPLSQIAREIERAKEYRK